jgi:hypothetical protein
MRSGLGGRDIPFPGVTPADNPRTLETALPDANLMTWNTAAPRSWSAAILAAIAVVVIAIVAVGFLPEPILRVAGWALVVDEPLAPADVIVVSIDSHGAGVLEAADLVLDGIAKRVAVFTEPPSGEDNEFMRRGLPDDNDGARQVRQLRSLGVTDIAQIPIGDRGTGAEGQGLASWCKEHQIRSVVFIGTTDHARRLRRVLGRVMKGHSTRIMVRPSRYSSFDPDQWWKTRGGLRTGIIELQKLTLDIVRHPFPF